MPLLQAPLEQGNSRPRQQGRARCQAVTQPQGQMLNPCHYHHGKGYAAKPPRHDAAKDAHHRSCPKCGVGKRHDGANHDGKEHEHAAPAGAKPVGGFCYGKNKGGPAGHLHGYAHIGRHGVAVPGTRYNLGQTHQHQRGRKRRQKHCPQR